MESDRIREFFDALAAGWDAESWEDNGAFARIADLLGDIAGREVIDLACGTGALFPELLSRAPARLTGIDLSGGMIEVAKSKFSDPRLTLLCRDFYDGGISPCDALTLHNAYPHFMDRELFVKRLRETLKPGGRFVIAHSAGRERINAHHGGGAKPISLPLLPANMEAERFSRDFAVTDVIDEENFYAIAGRKL